MIERGILVARQGDTFGTQLTLVSDVSFSKVEFICQELNICKEFSLVGDNSYYIQFSAEETKGFKSGNFIATIRLYVDNEIVVSKDYNFIVELNKNGGCENANT